VVRSAIVVLPERDLDAASRMISGLSDILEVSAVVAGGGTRQASVRRGLAMVSDDSSHVLCHDAARPFASPALYDAVLGAVSGEIRGAVPGIRSTDTVKRVEGSRVVETVPRDGLVLTQTPQAFDADALRESHERADAEGWEATDDALLLERAGFPIAVVHGEEMNFKITTEADLRRAESLVASGEL
jgi:2-C-methyl-D-erythritol 4-phosphate cytidylyltransferase / 2-C-methyl-D-erythritol 2,4-cyclodiphosphate synthase